MCVSDVRVKEAVGQSCGNLRLRPVTQLSLLASPFFLLKIQTVLPIRAQSLSHSAFKLYLSERIVLAYSRTLSLSFSPQWG